MKLRSPEVAFVESCAIETVVVGLGYRVGTKGHVITVHVIDIVAFVQVGKQRVGITFILLESLNGIPSHLGNLEIPGRWSETNDRSIEDTEAIDITLLATAAEKLHTDANAKDRLAETADEIGESLLIEILHRSFRFAYAWEDDMVGLTNGRGVVGNDSIASETSASTIDTVNVACVVFDDCYFHTLIVIPLNLVATRNARLLILEVGEHGALDGDIDIERRISAQWIE